MREEEPRQEATRPPQPTEPSLSGEDWTPGERLRMLRHQLGLSQAQLAAQLGYSKGQIVNLERGTTPMRHFLLTHVQALVEQVPLDRRFPAKMPRRGRRKHPPSGPRVLHHWDVAFVLVREVSQKFPCWHGPDPQQTPIEAQLDQQCQGGRYQFIALLPPTPHVAIRNMQTVTCDRHMVSALYWLKKQYEPWMKRLFRYKKEKWYERWLETMKRHGVPNEETPRSQAQEE